MRKGVKILSQRLPKGVVEKLKSGGGAHKDRKNDYRRAPKHKERTPSGEY